MDFCVKCTKLGDFIFFGCYLLFICNLSPRQKKTSFQSIALFAVSHSLTLCQHFSLVDKFLRYQPVLDFIRWEHSSLLDFRLYRVLFPFLLPFKIHYSKALIHAPPNSFTKLYQFLFHFLRAEKILYFSSRCDAISIVFIEELSCSFDSS